MVTMVKPYIIKAFALLGGFPIAGHDVHYGLSDQSGVWCNSIGFDRPLVAGTKLSLLVLYIEMIQNINDIVILLLGKNFVMILIILLEMNLQDKQIIYLLKRLLMNMIV